MNTVMRTAKKVWSLWDEFWFQPRPLLNLAVFRIVLCTVLFWMALARQVDVELLFTSEGFLPLEWAMKVMPEFYRAPFTWFFWGDAYASQAHAIYVLSLALLILGVGGRPLTLLAWVLHIGFLQRNYAVAFGADLIGGIFLCLMIGTHSCARLSLWNVFRRARFVESSDFLTGPFYRMIQIQLCVIYGYTGFEKLKGGTWWDGSAIWTVFVNSQMVVGDLSWTRHFPVLIVAMTFMTVLFEVYFPVLVWMKKLRPAVLIFGFFFHLGIGILMALMNFASLMLAPYVLFLPQESVRRWLVRLGYQG